MMAMAAVLDRRVHLGRRLGVVAMMVGRRGGRGRRGVMMVAVFHRGRLGAASEDEGDDRQGCNDARA
jgi:hypothetical protein